MGEIEQIKKCSKCGEIKPITEFGFSKSSKDRLRYECKSCANKRSREWREVNKKQIKEYWEKVKDRESEIRRNRYKNNREKQLEYRREYNKKNKEKLYQYKKEYYQKNKEKLLECQRNTTRLARENCTARYIKQVLREEKYPKDCITPELIKERGNIIKVRRIIKKINQSIN